MKLACKTSTIEIQAGLMHHLPEFKGRLAIITDDTVRSLYGEILAKSLNAPLFSFPAGEQSKTRATKERLEDQLFEKGFSRDTCIIALGGGVVTDLAGYLAATFCRGVPLILIPTTLLGMVDASIGGKVGVNVPFGKNMVGANYLPQKVLIDPLLLETLPEREFKQGMVEMIKHGLIADRAYFEDLNLLTKDSQCLSKAIYASCVIKKDIVEQDEKEQGKRRLLNFGHTVGHALEQITNYTLPHGDAVAIGILVESHLSMQLGSLKPTDFQHIQNCLERYKLPLSPPKHVTLELLMNAMSLDKKSLKGIPRFVILKDIGSTHSFNGEYCTPIDPSLLLNSLESIFHAMYSH